MLSNSMLWFVQLIPMACLAMADWRVALVAWLWLAKGVKEAQTPNIIEGWISQCVYYSDIM